MRNPKFTVLFTVGFALIAIIVYAPQVSAANCFIYSPDIGEVCSAQPAPAVFRAPTTPEVSVLDRITYAYLDDNINIYPEPSTAVPPSRNVGVGFLYVTLYGEVTVNGEKWYLINPGEYAQASGVHPVTTPTFRGVEITTTPEKPFGWVVQNVRPSSGPGEPENPQFSMMYRFEFFQTYGAQVADDGWIWYDLGGGRWVKQTYLSLVDTTPRPAEIGPHEYWVEVDLYEQTAAAYVGDQMVYATLISSGLNRWPTSEGLFQVWSRHLQTKMSGAEGKVDYYFIEDVPHTMYFDQPNQIALHGAYWHDRFGYKHSHGCVNMPPYDAEWIFNWSANAPNDLWVYVYTSDPLHYFVNYAN